MPADTFICGTCNSNFADLEAFVIHKKDPCQGQTQPQTDSQDLTNTLFNPDITIPFIGKI